MTLSSASSRVVYQGDGLVRNFAVPFLFLDAAHLVVVRRDAQGVETTLELTADYSVTGAGVESGGTVITNASPAVGEQLAIERMVPLTQEIDLVEGDPMPATTIEIGLDKSVMGLQQLSRQLQRALLVSTFATGPLAVPPPEAGKVLGWDTLGRLVNLAAPGGTGTTPSPVLDWDALGLIGDGIVDDAPILTRKAAEWSALGGAIFDIRPPEGRQLYLKSRAKLLSGIVVQYSGKPIRRGKAGGLRIEGDIAETPTTNKPRLLVDITAGTTTAKIDMGPAGGGAVSTFVSAGDYVIVRGRSDGSGAAEEVQGNKITAIDDGLAQITVADPWEFSFQVQYVNPEYELFSGGIPDRTYLSKQVRVALTADVARGVAVIPCNAAQIGQLAIGDLVELTTDSRTTSGNLDEVETREIVDIHGDGADTVTLNGRTARAYAVADGARLVKILPARGAVITGAGFVSIEAADPSPAPRRHCIEVAYGAHCLVVGCTDPNADAFGTRGQVVRFFHSYQSLAVECVVGPPKHLGSGDGYPFSNYYSTLCFFVRCSATGGRHNYLAQGATEGGTSDCIDLDARISGHDCHGCGEADVIGWNPTIIGGGKAVGSNVYAASFGNTTHHTGAHRCGIVGGRISNWLGSGRAAMIAHPPSTECFLRGVQLDDVETLARHSDLATAGSLVAERCAIEQCVVNGWTGWLLDLDGGRNGSASRTLKDFTVRDLRAYGGSRMVSGRQLDGLVLTLLDLSQITGDASEPYALKLTDTINLDASMLRAKGVRRGVQLTSCTGIIARSDFRNLTDGVVLLNGGGNTVAWRYNDSHGFTPVVSGGMTGIDAYPLLPDGSQDFLITG